MRFHIGVSFRWKSIKRFLFPILIGILTYFGLDFLKDNPLGFIQVKALENYSTNSIITYEESSIMNTLIDNTHTYSQFFQTIDSLKGQGAASRRLIAILIDDSNDYPWVDIYMVKGHNIQPSFYSNSSNLVSNIGWSSSGTSYNISFQPNVHNITNIYESDYYTQVYNCYVNDICTGDKLYSNSTSILKILGYSTSACNNSIDCYYNLNSLNTNTKSYIITSELPLEIKNTSSPSSSTRFYKTLVINGTTYNVGDFFPTYFELFPPIPANQINISNTQKHDDIFISNVPVNNLSNFKADFSYNYFDNPSNLTNFQQFFIGRINQGTYYSYEDINCFGALSFATDTTNKKINSTFKNISCTSSLTNYDEIFIRLRPTQGHGQNIEDLTLSSNFGFINRSPFYNGNNNYELMEYFDQLSSDFNILLSTSADIQYSSYISDTKYTMMTSISKNNNTLSGLSTNPSDYGSYNNTNLMIYNYLPSNNQNTNLYLFFDTESILSLSSNSGTFTYYNNNNNIVSNTITNGYQIDSSSYDLDSIFDRVNNFIDGLQDDMSEVHNLLQTSFDSLASSIKLVIIIIYILTLAFLLFKVIRK